MDDGLLFVVAARAVREVFPVVEDYGEADGCRVFDEWEVGGEMLEHAVDVHRCVVVALRLRVGG